MTAISIIGAGYVGLVTGVGLAHIGHDVVCVDKDDARIAEIRAGRTPFHEPGLQEILETQIGGRFRVTSDLAAAVAATDVTFIAVGTPSGPDGIDLRFVEAATSEIGEALRDKGGRHTVVVKSTVIPGTTDGVVTDILERCSRKTAGEDFGVASNPEFLTEGRAVVDFFEPDRIVIGVDGEATADTLQSIYETFDQVPLLVTNARTAEMIKYASNALLATMISFTNELANLGAAIGGIDTVEVMRGVHESRYLTSRSAGEPITAEIASFLSAGCGFGGSCLPKDVAALAASAEAIGASHAVLDSVLETNRLQPAVLVDLVERGLGGLSDKVVAVLGLAFKPDTSDLRETPALPVIDGLLEAGAQVLVHDPIVDMADLPDGVRDSVRWADSVESVAEVADAIVIVTRWDLYRSVPAAVRALSRPPLVVDGRRMLDPASLPRYSGIGF